ncbi:TetR/AcrR family transcriptional regulator [Christiangramia salexigens]|uniref:TetR family transcriptional regulator n=1 Tax=Christiangramia salexigens TaxID=1913577 RepID=A0A1L3J778_9FLAO|nr:TetR/AcrR family transcriptional regulator [Christiangramia salexigens]APG60970.1 TetR family transcriptional regulator [Christiangramia salexigens]
MREKILDIAVEMFLNYGFKSVTMDDIAEKMGISKKTIYAHFSTKTKLVEATSIRLFEKISEGIEEIRSKEQNPIVENFEIKRFAMFQLKDEKTTPHFQLQKYYPKIFEFLKDKQFELLESCVVSNLERGIENGYYRKDLPINFISRIHFAGLMGIKDRELFPMEYYSQLQLMNYFLEYHLRAICTEKGIRTLEEFKSEHEN